MCCFQSAQGLPAHRSRPIPELAAPEAERGGAGWGVPLLVNSARKSGESEPRSRAGKRGKRPLRPPTTTPTLWMGKLRPGNRVHHTELSDKRNHESTFLKDSEDI